MTYKLWMTVHCSHIYFGKDKCGIEIQPTKETASLLNKAGILWRKMNVVSWVLIKEEPEEEQINRAMLIFSDNQEVLEFKLNPIFPEISYFTQWKEVRNDHWTITQKNNQGQDEWFLLIPVTPGLLGKTLEINIEIQSKTVGWEFILIPKYTSRNATIELRENYGKLDFSIMEEVLFPGEGNVFRCVTKSNIVMKEIYDYKICLWERKENGELMLNSNIPFPKPNVRSILDPHERITSYFYF